MAAAVSSGGTPGAAGPGTPSDGVPSAFRMYFNDVSTTTRLSAEQERADALQLGALRQALWRQLLAHPAMVARILALFADDDAGSGDSQDDGLAGFDPNGLPARLAEQDADLVRANAAMQLARSAVQAGRAPRAFGRACEAARSRLMRARDAFVTANLGLVVALARRYERGHLSMLDLIQEGNAGLLKAVDRFDPGRGVRFSTYAAWWIRHAVGRALSDRSREIRLPVHVVERQQRLARAKARFELEQGRQPSDTELATVTQLPADTVERLVGAVFVRATGVDREGRVGPCNVEDLPDKATPLFAPDEARYRRSLAKALESLPPAQLDVLTRRYGLDGGDPMTLREVGELHELSRERIRQIQARAVASLRRQFEREGLLAS